ncbi:MAG TPA: hypothetical protein VF067_07445 [Sphingomicrobium sp.]
MATIAADPGTSGRLSRRSREHLFFWAMSMLLAVIVFIGFARTYFLAGYFHSKPLAAPIVHVHGALFTAWILLLVTQSSLAASGNLKIHRRLGLLGLGLAPLVFLLGVLVANEMLRRLSGTPHFDAERIYAVALSEIIGFAVPTFLALGLRRWSAYHKRLILIGTIAMMTAAFGRWPIHALLHRPLPAMACTFSLLGLVAAYDVSSLRKVHPATLLGSAWVIAVELTSIPVSHSAAWHAFAIWSRSL